MTKIWFKKYDVFFSFAEEDLLIAEKIASSLRARGISYYLYTEQPARTWGGNLFKMLIDGMGRSKYILRLNSKYYAQKYWTSIETHITGLSKLFVLELFIDEST